MGGKDVAMGSIYSLYTASGVILHTLVWNWWLFRVTVAFLGSPTPGCHSDLWHQQGMSVHTTAPSWIFPLFGAIFCKPSRWLQQCDSRSSSAVWHQQQCHVQSHLNLLSLVMMFTLNMHTHTIHQRILASPQCELCQRTKDTAGCCGVVLHPIPSDRPLIQPLLSPELCLCFCGEPADPWPLANESDNED